MGFPHPSLSPVTTLDKALEYLARDADNGVLVKGYRPLSLVLRPVSGPRQIEVYRGSPHDTAGCHVWVIDFGGPVSHSHPEEPHVQYVAPTDPATAEIHRRRGDDLFGSYPGFGPPTALLQSIPAVAAATPLMPKLDVPRNCPFLVPTTTYIWREREKLPAEMLSGFTPEEGNPDWGTVENVLIASVNPGYNSPTSKRGWMINADGLLTEICPVQLDLPSGSSIHGPWFPAHPDMKVWHCKRSGEATAWFWGKHPPGILNWVEGTGKLDDRPVRVTVREDGNFTIASRSDSM